MDTPTPESIDLQGSQLADGVVPADCVFTGTELLWRSSVRVASGRVVEVGVPPPREGGPTVADRFRLAIPGFLNAHVHLELSDRCGRIPAEADFTRWLEKVRAARPAATPASLRSAVERGLRELVASGTTAVIDFSHRAVSVDALARTPLRHAVLREVLGLTPDRWKRELQDALAWRLEVRSTPRRAHGLAAHAPFSCHSELLREVAGRTGSELRAIHVAEDPAERQWLADGSGRFADFLRRLGIDEVHWPRPRLSPVAYLEAVGLLGPQTLAIHANDLDAADLDRLEKTRTPVVYCPGTHEFFRRPPHPFGQLLDRGLPLALGTDSAASNDGLSMLAEARRARRDATASTARQIVEIACGARLGPAWPGAGTIAAGDVADLAVFEIEGDAPSGDPLEALLSRPARCCLTMAGGRLVYRRGGLRSLASTRQG